MQNLIAYIRRHSIKATEAGAMIMVETVYCKDGKAFTEIEFVEPTFQAVRDYLGY